MSDPKTVRVRIAVAVDWHGDWRAYGNPAARDSDVLKHARENLLRWTDGPLSHAIHWIEADVPIPDPQTVEGQVVTPAQEQ